MKIKYRDLYKFISEVIVSSGIDLSEVIYLLFLYKLIGAKNYRKYL